MNKFSRLLIAVVLIAAVVAGVFGPASVGSPSEASAAVMASSNVAMIPNYYNGSVGAFPISGTVYGTSLSFNQFTFTDLSLANLNLANLSAFDTVVLNQNFTNNLTAQQKADLNSWVDAGGKLIIYDSDTTSGNEYSWLIRPFTTNVSCPNCGMVSGTLTIAEENTLSSSDPLSPYFINTTEVATESDAVGDANVFLTQDPNWFGDMLATNGLGATGWTHAYAETPSGKGLIIYNGLDIDYLGWGSYYTSGIDWLAKIWYYELAQQWDPSELPGTTPIAGQILLSPLTATLDTGQSHTVTARVSDSQGMPLFGAVVTFTVTGANSASGTDITDTQGSASFYYTGQHEGRDTIVASSTIGGENLVSNDVHVDWTAPPSWTFTAPYSDFISSSWHTPCPPPGDSKVLAQGFSTAVTVCDPASGTFKYKVSALGGTAGGISFLGKKSSLPPPSQEAHAEAEAVIDFMPSFTGDLRVEVNLTINGKTGASAGSALAASISVPDEIGGALIDYLTKQHLSLLLTAAKAALRGTASNSKTEAFLVVSGGASGSIYSELAPSPVATCPLGPLLQRYLWQERTVQLSTVVQVVKDQPIRITTGTRSHVKAWGWAFSYTNLDQPDTVSTVDSIVLSKQ